MVTVAVTGACLTLFHAAGARLKPISDTMAPVTMGGMMRSIHPAPAQCTIRPTTSSSVPAEITPPWASAIFAGSSGAPPPAT